MTTTAKRNAKREPAPKKKTLRVSLDADVLAWLKKDGRGWNARANRMLREEMREDLEGR